MKLPFYFERSFGLSSEKVRAESILHCDCESTSAININKILIFGECYNTLKKENLFGRNIKNW